jgi:SRSO17 transposase
MLQRALDAEVPASWVTADEAYGGDPALRRFLEDRGLSYVLAVKCTEPLRPADGSARATAEQLAVGVPTEQWVTCSAGHGAKGRRLYDWTRVALAVPAAADFTRWLLVRRSRSDGELAFYACYAPAGTSLVGLVRVAGTRWAIEESFQCAKGEVGLDHYEVRRWPGWYRHITLALLAHAFLTVTRDQATTSPRQGGTRPDRRAGHAPADRPRGPPPAGRPGVDHTYPAWLCAGLVAVAPSPPGPR